MIQALACSTATYPVFAHGSSSAHALNLSRCATYQFSALRARDEVQCTTGRVAIALDLR